MFEDLLLRNTGTVGELCKSLILSVCYWQPQEVIQILCALHSMSAAAIF